MTTFAEQMASDLDVLFDLDEFAETVTYSDGTTSSDVPAIVDYEPPAQNADAGIRIMVKKSDVAAPGYRHSFTIGGDVWYVAMDGSRPLIKGDSLVWSIDLVHGERTKSWRT